MMEQVSHAHVHCKHAKFSKSNEQLHALRLRQIRDTGIVDDALTIRCSAPNA
uniref:Uncharacterized protein n=1 Tax=Aegilops tauschii subsp. strangulata TaxID=200361 RepID=A0A453MQY5_AEGTS